MTTWRVKSSSDTDTVYEEISAGGIPTGVTKVEFKRGPQTQSILAFLPETPPPAQKSRAFLAGLSAGIVGTLVFEAGRYLLS